MVEVKCFHVEKGRPCTRYLAGSRGERRQTIERIEKGIAAARELRSTAPYKDWAYYDGMIDALETMRDGIKAGDLHRPEPSEPESVE